MSFWKSFWSDEAGAVLSAEAALVATLGVLGASVGLKSFAGAVNNELTDVARAMRSLDQSYCVSETKCCGNWTAGSAFKQTPVEESLKELNAQIEQEHKAAEKLEQQVEEPKKKKNKKNKKDKNSAQEEPQPPADNSKPGGEAPTGAAQPPAA